MSARPGAATSPSNGLTSNVSPSASPARSRSHGRRERIARATTASATTSSAATTLSIVSLRAVITATGRTASAIAPASPAARPNSVRSASYSATTATQPAIAAGRCSPTDPNPTTFVAATCSHR